MKKYYKNITVCIITAILITYNCKGNILVFESLNMNAEKTEYYIHIWDITNTQPLQTFVGKNPIFSPNGKALAFYTSNTIKILHTNNWQEITSLDVPFAEPPQNIALSLDKNLLALSDKDKTVICNITTQEIIKEIEHERANTRTPNHPIAMAFSPNQNILVIRNLANFSVFNTKNWNKLITFKLRGRTKQHLSASLVFSSDGNLLAFSANGTIQIFSTLSWRMVKSFSTRKSVCKSICFSPKNTEFFYATDDGNIFIIDTENWQEKRKFSILHNIISFALTPDATKFACQDMCTQIKIHDALTGESIKSLQVDNLIYSLTFKPKPENDVNLQERIGPEGQRTIEQAGAREQTEIRMPGKKPLRMPRGFMGGF